MNVEDQSVSKMEYLLLIAEVNRLARLLENTKAESRRFQEKLAALQWRRITEQDLPKEGDEVYAPESGELAEQVTIFDAYSKLDPPRWIEDGWTHFRALIATPADKAGA